jgi:hypothetical protein
MKHKYDLFEKFADGSSLWRACVIGLEGAQRHMRELALDSPNQFYAMHLVSGKVFFLHAQSHRHLPAARAEKHSVAVSA